MMESRNLEIHAHIWRWWLCSVDHAVWLKRSLLSIWRYRSFVVQSRPPQGWKVIAGVCRMKKTLVDEQMNLDRENFVAELRYLDEQFTSQLTNNSKS